MDAETFERHDVRFATVDDRNVCVRLICRSVLKPNHWLCKTIPGREILEIPSGAIRESTESPGTTSPVDN